MADRIETYADALFNIASAEGKIDEVQDELFRFGRALEGSDALKNTLTDDMVPAAKRQAVVEDLLGGKASSVTTQLISFVVGSGRGRDLPAIINKLVDRAAANKQRTVAEVRTAIALSEDQKVRLAAALSNATGKAVELKVLIDPTVLGGVVAQVGDQIIDGSVRTRLDQLTAQL
jgi:F-type H+-transporting ATPase subunit delta